MHIIIFSLFAADEKVITINKNLVEKKRGECVTFQGERYFKTNNTFIWKKRETTTMVSNDRITISNGGRKIEIGRLEEADTALYSSMIHTAGGLEITRYWLVVRGKFRENRKLFTVQRQRLQIVCYQKLPTILIDYIPSCYRL